MNRTDPTSARPGARKNQFLLLLILFLDLVGFALIFPLVPELLDFYRRGVPGQPIDTWFLSINDALFQLLPLDRRSHENQIIIMGGVLASLYSVLQFMAAPYWGKLSDRIGRRPVLLVTSLGLALSYLIWSVSLSFTAFIGARILGGLMAGNMSVASAAMADMSPIEHRTRALGLVGAAFGMGFVVGPALGGISSLWDISHLATFFTPFSFTALVAFLLGILSAGLNLGFLKETLGQRNGDGPLWIQNPIKVIRSRLDTHRLGRILALNFLYLITFSAFEFSFTFFYKLDFGLDPSGIGLIFLYLGVLLVLGQGGLVRALEGRMDGRKMAILGFALLPLPMYLMAYTAPSVGLSLVCLFPIAIGSSLIQPALAGLTSLNAAEDRQGLALGVLRSTGSLGRAIGPLGGAYLYWFLGIHDTYLVIAILLLLVVLLALSAPDPTRPPREEAP